MSQMETTIKFETRHENEFDLFEGNYYKLPFCDEELQDIKDLCGVDNYWNDHMESDLDYDVRGLTSPITPGYCFSPSSLSSGSSSGQNHPDPSHLLLNERPDTPLMAIKFEEFSSDYGLADLGYPTFAEQSTCGDETMTDVNVDDEIMSAEPLNLKVEPNKPIPGLIPTGSERTVDCTLASAAATSTVDNNATITISKAEDGSPIIKANSLLVDNKEPDVTFSFNKDQPISTTTADNQTLSSNPTKVTSSKTTLDDLLGIAEIVSQPHKIKFTPQAKITTNTFTHKAQIQIPTSTLQTILKNGRFVTKLQQHDGQPLPKIHIKAESNGDTPHFLKIYQPQTELPPTPPSSNSSDAEGSSSPRSRVSSNGGSPTSHSTHMRVQPSGSHLAAQLISSTQRFTQAHGPLKLTEEEKRTLVAEGYPVPSKLPLTKSEEKSLKKIRRKIKNKLSAQESRRKKKEYVETLEKKVDVCNKENNDLKRKVDSLESSNRSLLSQLRSLQTLVAGKMPKPSRTVTTQTSSCLMMMVLCFAVLLGGWYPHLSPWKSSDMTSLASSGTPFNGYSGESRILHSFKEDDACRESMHCYGYKEEWTDHEAKEADGSLVSSNDGNSDTYDEPTGGRVTMNDTGDQTSKIIANTMEARTVADVLAGRKVMVKSSKMEVVVDGKTPRDVTKKIIVSSQLVTE